MNIDWSKAPEGATHYQIEGDIWYKQNHAAYQWDDGEWIKLARSDLGEYTLPSLVERPAHAEWVGQGLPPVGTVCEWNYGGRAEWYVATILYIGSVYMIASSNDGEQHYYLRDIRFRPIRSSWQIAEQARQESVAEMLGIFKFSDDKQEMLRATCFALYDAGYRKQEQPK